MSATRPHTNTVSGSLTPLRSGAAAFHNAAVVVILPRRSTIGRSTLGVSPSPIAKRVPGTPGSAGLAAAARTPLSDAARKLLAAKAAQAVRVVARRFFPRAASSQ